MPKDINLDSIDLSIAGLKAHYQNGDFTPRELFGCIRKQIVAESSNPAFIHLLNEEELEPYFVFLDKKSIQDLPLFGVPFAVKDNIDVADVPTTVACPAYRYVPDKHAHVIEKFVEAGAVPLGKTNMDQFATGLVGVRSPWGACKNTLNSDYISGGSSSGSAVAVAKGWATFSLGTDTAGSGRVPASLNNIVGLKPSCGLLSNSGVVPACKSIDCVSIFSTVVADANAVFDIAASYDIDDPFSRQNPFDNGVRYFSHNIKPFQFGVPKRDQLEFFGNSEAEQLFDLSLRKIQDIGGTPVEIDFSVFSQAAKLLYEGPWVTERYLVTQSLLDKSPDDIHPVVRAIVEGGGDISATEVYSALYSLHALKQKALKELEKVDCMVTPTNGTIYTIDEVEHDPIQLNSNLGFYTNFMNLLDFSAVASPTGFYENGVGFGVTLFAKAFSDKQLLSLAACLQKNSDLPLGATKRDYKDVDPQSKVASGTVDVVVCGAHLEGFPLNWQLVERGAKKLLKTMSAPVYRLFALAGGPPLRPGMVRDEKNGVPIEVEVWRVPKKNFGSFVAEIPAPLGIGKVELGNGEWVSGFICEGAGIEGAKDISEFGGWRNFVRPAEA